MKTRFLFPVVAFAIAAMIPNESGAQDNRLIRGRFRLATLNSVSNVRFSPETPASLVFGENVTVTFDYTTVNSDGVRIFVLPMTEGNPSLNYAVSGSPLYAVGSGSGTGTITIRSGMKTVDHVQIKMTTADQSEQLFLVTVPTAFTFHREGVAIAEFDIPPDLGLLVEPPVQPAACEAPVREVLPDGKVKTTYPDGKTQTEWSGGFESCEPDEATGELRCTIAFFMSVPRLVPNEDLASIDAAWLNGMNDWMEHISDVLLKRIETLSDEQSVQNYLAFEAASGASLYERVDKRLEFSERLMAWMTENQ